LRLYFRAVIEWVEHTFKNYRKEMKGVNWGKLYNGYGAPTTSRRGARAVKLSLEIVKCCARRTTDVKAARKL
jgi:hypothetical protein